MQVNTQVDQSNRKNNKIRRDVFQSVLLVFIIVVISLGAGYAAGFQMGKRQGAKAAVQKVTDLINPLNAISDNPLFPSTVLGKVSAVSETSLKVKLANGKDKTIVINEKTTVTKGDKTLTLKDVTKDANVTVLTQGKDREQTATRIVLR